MSDVQEAWETLVKNATPLQEMTIAQVEARIDSQIEWAKDRMVAAERDGDEAGKESWFGYVQALRWVKYCCSPNRQGNGQAS